MYRFGKIRGVTLSAILWLIIFFPATLHAADLTKILPSSLSPLIQQPTITAIYQDHYGYLWIGTQQGLYKFDGARVHYFSTDKNSQKPLPFSDIRGISEDQWGNIILATFGGGIVSWSEADKRFKQISHPSLQENQYLTDLYSTEIGDFWISGKSGVLIFDNDFNKEETWLKDSATSHLLGDSVTFSGDSLGNIYLGGPSGLFIVSEENRKISRLSLAKDEPHVTSIYSGLNDQLYIGTTTGKVIHYDLSERKINSSIQLGNSKAVSITAIGSYGKNIWIGTNVGLYHSDFSLKSYSSHSTANSKISNNHITAFYTGPEIFWIGTYQGLNTVSSTPFELYDEENSDINNDVLAFEQDNSGRLWIATYNGLYRLDSETGGHIRVFGEQNSLLRDQRVMSIELIDDNLWLGLWKGGIRVLNPKNGTLSKPSFPGLEGLAVTKILQDNKSQIWIATYNRGLLRIDQEQVNSYPEFSGSPVTTLYQAVDQALYATTEKEVYKYDRLNDRFYRLDFSFHGAPEPLMILSMGSTVSGGLLLGTKDHGLYIWKPLDIQESQMILHRFGNDPGTGSLSVYGIIDDETSGYWLSSQQGIVQINYHGELLAKYSTSDGLQANDFNFGAYFIDSIGYIYFGGVNGYNRFLPSNLFSKKPAPELLMSDIYIANSTTSPTLHPSVVSSLELSHRNYLVTFTFSILDYLNPFKSHYKYKLEGFDPDWIDNGTRNSATYTNLPAGDYVFRVIGANSAGVWNEEGISINLKVLPPPWKTWWAYLLYFLAAMTFIWVVMRSYHTYIVKEKALELAEEMYRAADRAEDDMLEQQEMQDELVKAVYQHNLATLRLIGECLHAQANSGSSGPDHQGHIDALTILENCYYYQGGELLTDLHRFTEALISRLLQAAPINPASITTINRVSSNLLPASIASPLALAIYELLDNAVQHAFDGQSPANFIEVSLDAVDNGSGKTAHMQLVVSDDGIGLPVDIQPSEANSHGFQILQVLCTILSATISCDTRNGTVISLIFPQHIPE